MDTFTLRPVDLRHEGGYLLIELVVSMVVLVVGVLGTFVMLDTANRVTRQTLVRDGATSLTREVLERARQLPYAQLAPAGTAERVRLLMPGATARDSGTFEATRRGSGYAMTVTACRVDAPGDGIGVHDGSWCDRNGVTPPLPRATQTFQGLVLTASGTLLERVCALLGTVPSGADRALDAVIGRGTALGGLLAQGAGLRTCASTGERMALDEDPDDLTRIIVHTTAADGPTDERAVLIPNPDAA